MGPSVFWIFTLFVISVLSTSNAARCHAPQGKFGVCEHLRKCPAMLQLLLQAGQLPVVENYLKKATCGGDITDPKVCCTSDIHLPELETVHEDTENKPATSGTVEHPYLPRDCGRGPYEYNDRYHTFAAIDEFPWMAILEYVGDNETKSYCTGSLISRRYVLTTARCITDIPNGYKLTRVRLGEYDRNSDPDCSKTSKGDPVCAGKSVVVGIRDIIIHHDYRKERNGYRNDIALLRLSGNVNFNDFIQSICLPSHDSLPEEFVSSGWGLVGQQFSVGIKYRNVLPLADRAVCSRNLRPSFSNVMKSHICVGREISTNACRRDQGGPLMVFEGDEYNGGRWICKGVLSYGSSNCGQDAREESGVYTNVYEYVPWITTHLT